MHKIKQAQSDPQFNKYSHDTRCLYACRQHFRGMKRHDSRCVCVCECRQPFRGMRQHVEVRQSGWCRALMISPCSCGSPASVRNLSSDSPATCSSSTRYTPAAALGCCLKRLSIWALKILRVIIRTTRSCPAREPGTPRLLQAAALPGSHYDH